MKREIPETILIVKIIEWRKCIDYFALSIEADPSRVIKKNIYFSSSGKPHILKQQMNKKLNLKPLKLHLYQLTKNIASEIVPHIFYTMRYLAVILIYIYYLVVPNLLIKPLQVLHTHDTGHKTNRKIHRIMCRNLL